MAASITNGGETEEAGDKGLPGCGGDACSEEYGVDHGRSPVGWGFRVCGLAGWAPVA